MPRLAVVAVVLDGEQPVSWHALGRAGVAIRCTAGRTRAAVTLGRADQDEGLATSPTRPRLLPDLGFSQLPAGRANQDVQRVSAVLGHQVAGEQVDVPATGFTGEGLDP